MINIKVLGTGCSKCTKLAANAEEAAKELGIEFELEKISGIQDIITYGVMITPGLFINDKLISSGRLHSVKELKEILSLTNN